MAFIFFYFEKNKFKLVIFNRKVLKCYDLQKKKTFEKPLTCFHHTLRVMF